MNERFRLGGRGRWGVTHVAASPWRQCQLPFWARSFVVLMVPPSTCWTTSLRGLRTKRFVRAVLAFRSSVEVAV